MVVPRHLFTNNPSHLFQINPLHARPLRASNLHATKHTSAYMWPKCGPTRVRRRQVTALAQARYAGCARQVC
jgi:hypothetical protein